MKMLRLIQFRAASIHVRPLVCCLQRQPRFFSHKRYDLKAERLQLDVRRQQLQADEWDWMMRRAEQEEADLKDAFAQQPLKQDKTFFFYEDHQMHDHAMYVFETNAPLTTRQMEQLTWRQPGAGRMSASFGRFAEDIRKQGFHIRTVRVSTKAEVVPKGVEVVYGATGNY